MNRPYAWAIDSSEPTNLTLVIVSSRVSEAVPSIIEASSITAVESSHRSHSFCVRFTIVIAPASNTSLASHMSPGRVNNNRNRPRQPIARPQCRAPTVCPRSAYNTYSTLHVMCRVTNNVEHERRCQSQCVEALCCVLEKLTLNKFTSSLNRKWCSPDCEDKNNITYDLNILIKHSWLLTPCQFNIFTQHLFHDLLGLVFCHVHVFFSMSRFCNNFVSLS